MTLLPLLCALLGIVVCSNGCTLIPSYTRANQESTADWLPTRATEQLQVHELPYGVFVGIAMSGGGSRAANFSASVLCELQSLGFLPYVTALSAVSGSALPAMYYGVSVDASHPLDCNALRAAMSTDFRDEWIFRWFLPWNIGRYWFTHFTRSNIMANVFDANLFKGKTFHDLGTTGPKILLNATQLADGSGFTFTDEAFRQLHSRLDTYPVSQAVMASGAFPGIFHNVTIENYDNAAPWRYGHLFDGGAFDNLGINPLLSIAQRLYYPPSSTSDSPLAGCFFFLIDAYTFLPGKGGDEPDTRKPIDYLIDTNMLAATDALLGSRRRALLQQAGFPEEDIGKIPFKVFAVPPPVNPAAEVDNAPAVRKQRIPLQRADGTLGAPKNPSTNDRECSVWHLTFQRLKQLSSTQTADLSKLSNTVNNIDTDYKLISSSLPLNSQTLQDALYTAGHVLVQEDEEGLRQACCWFRTHGFQELPCIQNTVCP